MKLKLKIWRQADSKSKGRLEKYDLNNISPDMSFVEMLDELNENLIKKGQEPIAFDSDCREGICGCCSQVINGIPHGKEKETATCQLHMRKFKDGETIIVEPFRAKSFPVLKDLMIDRGAFDKIIQAGGFISVNTGSASEANSIPVKKEDADKAMDAAQCIGCGACVAACKNASAMLFVSAKISHLALLPQGKIEAKERAKKMISKMDELGFGNCSNEGECESVCPKGIKISNIARLNRELIKAQFNSP